MHICNNYSRFLLNLPVSAHLLRVRLVPKSKLFGTVSKQASYRQDAIPITQPTASKHQQHRFFKCPRVTDIPLSIKLILTHSLIWCYQPCNNSQKFSFGDPV